MDVGLLILRIVIGAVIVIHGTQKLWGWGGGFGLDGAVKLFTGYGYRPVRLVVIVAALTETIAGTLFALGLFTEFAATALVAVTVNIFMVHRANGFSNAKKGYEYELSLFAVFAAVAFTGPGSFSLDKLWGINLVGIAEGILGLEFAPYVAGILMVLLGIVIGALISSTRRPQQVAQASS